MSKKEPIEIFDLNEDEIDNKAENKKENTVVRTIFLVLKTIIIFTGIFLLFLIL